MKKLALVLLVLAVAISSVFAAAEAESASNNTTEERVLKNKIRIGMNQILADVIPYNNNTANYHFLYTLYLDPLVRLPITTETNYEPNLAKSWDISEDSLKYTFHLRDDVYFSNGEHMTSEDVVWSYETAKSYSSQSSKYNKVSAIYALDEYTVVFELSEVEADILSYLSSLNNCILCKKAVEEDPEKGWLVGTGAYKVVENISKDHTLFQKNEYYWGDKDAVKTEYIEAVYITEATTRGIAVQTGELDFANDLLVDDIPSFDSYPNAEVLLVNTYGLTYAAVNVSGVGPNDAADQNIHLRKALQYATDTESILALCCGGIGEVPNGVIPVGYAFYTEPNVKYEFDLEKAKEEFALSGLEQGVTLQILCKDSTYPGLFEVLKDQWSKIGVNLEITTTATVNNLMYDVTVAKWTPSNLQAMMVAMWTENASSRTKDYSNADLVAPCSAVLDIAERTARYAKLQDAVMENACMIPLWIRYIPYGINANLEGYYIDPSFGNSDFRFAYCYE